VNTVSEERLLAWLDGELDAVAAAEVARAVAADPALAERVRNERALRDRLRAAFAPALEEETPQRLLATLGMAQEAASPAPAGTGNVASLRPRAAAQRVRGWRWPEWTALAASLVVGALVGAQFLHAPASGPVRMQNGMLVASDALSSVLDDKLASDSRPGDALAVGLSFRDSAGAYCRTFTAHGAQPLGGLACHAGGKWRVVALGQAQRQGGELRQAATALPASVLAEVDARQKEMLDAAGERAARDAGWR
jgi:hypothetical protein